MGFDINNFYIDDEDYRKAIVNIKWAWSSLSDYHEAEQILAIMTLATKSVAHEMKKLDDADRKLCVEKIREILEIELPETIN